MALVTVAMPAYNAAQFIHQAIASIQQQCDVDWELIVVDDASTDDTTGMVRGFNDPRIRLLCNETRRGIGYCHNRIVAESSAPYVSHVDADDYILPGALRKLIAALENNLDAGQSYCQFYDVDRGGRVLREVFLHRIKIFQQRAQGIDYKRDLIAVGTVINALRTYPRRVLKDVGAFNDALPFGVDYEMAVRIADRYQFAFVPEFLYVRRLHSDNTTETLPFKRFKFFWQRYQICRALSRSGQVTFFHQAPYDLNRLLLTSLSDTLALPRVPMFVRDKVLPWPRTVRAALQEKVVQPAQERMYEFAVYHGGWWQLEWRSRRFAKQPLRLGYYLWRFPSVSDTFIRREVQALRETGIDLQVFADRPGDLDDPALAETIQFLQPPDPQLLAHAGQYFRTRSRLRYWNVFLYVALHRYGSYKTWREDRHMFDRALELAYQLRENKITHLHMPWADRTAFIGLAAAALLDIPFSVEARAHDLHRAKSQYGLREKFANADFIITNSDYNARAIDSYLDTRRPPIHVIRELFPLSQFTRAAPHKRRTDRFQILCVARLIEEKGLVYLLRACARLRDRGLAFECEIIGGTEEPTYINYLIELKRLHRQLQLQEHVCFAGPQPFARVLDAYARVDLFVLPCVIAENGGRDISPNSLIEAMALGLPVISTQLSAIPEIVQDGVSGVLVPPNDDAALANAIEALMHDPLRRRELGAQASARVHARYDAAKNVTPLVSLFRAGAQ